MHAVVHMVKGRVVLVVAVDWRRQGKVGCGEGQGQIHHRGRIKQWWPKRTVPHCALGVAAAVFVHTW